VARLKTLTISDIPQALELSSAEGWNQTEKNWKLLIENPGNVCLALEEEGKIVATVTAMNYENRVTWIGMVLVEKSHRGRGYSKLLLSELLNHLKFFPTIKLDATSAGQPVYQKFGFRNERIISRYVLESPASNMRDLEIGNLPKRIYSSEIQEVVKYDATVFGARRKRLIEYLIQENPENTWGIKQNNVLKGIALGRKGARFFQLGPVSADSEKEAGILLSQMLKKLPHLPVVVDVWEEKTELINWLKTIGFRKQRQFVRMVLGEYSPEISEKQFLICGPEFG
jgi:GNAT superfamily N-acetyltransferase